MPRKKGKWNTYSGYYIVAYHRVFYSTILLITLYLEATPNYLQLTCYMFRPLLGYYQELPVTRKSYQDTMLRVIKSFTTFFIIGFDWNVLKVCNLQDIVKNMATLTIVTLSCVFIFEDVSQARLFGFYYLFFMAPQPRVGRRLVFVKVSKSHSGTPHSVKLL